MNGSNDPYCDFSLEQGKLALRNGRSRVGVTEFQAHGVS